MYAQVFQAHVNDLCASIFIAVVRQYDPDTKGTMDKINACCCYCHHAACRRLLTAAVVNFSTEDVEPVDKDTVAKVTALEKKLKEKEAAVKALREQVCSPIRFIVYQD